MQKLWVAKAMDCDWDGDILGIFSSEAEAWKCCDAHGAECDVHLYFLEDEYNEEYQP